MFSLLKALEPQGPEQDGAKAMVNLLHGVGSGAVGFSSDFTACFGLKAPGMVKLTLTQGTRRLLNARNFVGSK